LREKLRLIPTVDDVIEAVVLGEQITSDTLTPEIIAGLLIRAADERKIDTSEITVGHLRETSYHFLGDRSLVSLVNHAQRNKPPDKTAIQFLQEMSQQEIRRQRELGAQAKNPRSTLDSTTSAEVLRTAWQAARRIFPGDNEDAADAVGEGVLYVVNKCAKAPDTIQNLPAFTYIATKTRAMQIYNGKKREVFLDPQDPLDSPSSSNPLDLRITSKILPSVASAEKEFFTDEDGGDEMIPRVKEALKRLPPERKRGREIIEAILSGLTYQQISMELDIPIGSIGPTLARTAKALKEILDAEE